MVERSQLVQNLRDHLKDGATVLRLIRDVIAQLGDTASSREVQEVLAESFQLPVVRLGPSLDLDQRDYRQGILNRTLLAEIVENRERWEALMSSPGNSSWLDGLHVTSPEEVRKKLAADSYPGLSRESWAALRPDEQQALLVQLASGLVLSARLEILSRLAERLQDKIDARKGDASHIPDRRPGSD
jgi:hypothetical protein